MRSEKPHVNSVLVISILILLSAGDRTKISSQPTSAGKSVRFDDGFSEANIWRTFDNWECNVPPATIDGFAIAPIRNGSSVSEKVSGIFLFGGQRFYVEESTANQTWFFDVDEQLWSKVKTKNHPPTRSNHSMVSLCDETVVLIGGRRSDSETKLTDVWVFNIKTAQWTEVIPDGDDNDRSPSTFFKTTARVAFQTASNCSCKQSVVVLANQLTWSTLWELRCIQDQIQYKWFRVETISQTNPSGKRGQLTASAGAKGVIYALDNDGLWTFSLSNRQWNKQNNSFHLPVPPKARRTDFLTFLEETDQLLLISTTDTTLYVQEPSNQSSTLKWTEGIAVGNSPVQLTNTHNTRYVYLHKISDFRS